MAETFSTDCGFYANGNTNYMLGTTNGDIVPRQGNAASDLARGLGMRLTGTAAAPAPHRSLVNQTLPTGTLLIQTVPGAETNTFTSRVKIGGTYINPGTIGGTQTAGTIPAGALNILGSTLEIDAWGTLGTTGTPNLTIDVGLGAAGANVLCTSGVLALAAVTTPNIWFLKVFATVTTAGASGVVVSAGIFTYGNGASGLVSVPWVMGNSTPGTGLSVDLTTALAFDVFATCGTSSASNRIRQYGCVVKLIG